MDIPRLMVSCLKLVARFMTGKDIMGQIHFDPIEFSSAAEVLETAMELLAPIIYSYFESLKEAGLPEEVASQLVQDWHKLYWDHVIKLSPQAKS